MDLDSLDKYSIGIVTEIVNRYNISLNELKEDKDTLLSEPGCPFLSLFNTEDCLVGFYKKVDAIAIEINIIEEKYSSFSEAEKRDLYFSIRKLKKNEFIQTVFLLKKLYENGYIFFSKKSNEILRINEYEHDSLRNKKLVEGGLRPAIEFYYSPGLLDFIEKYQDALIIPSFELITYKDNGDKTSAEKRHCRDLKVSIWAIVVAILIGIGSPVLMTKCSKTTIDDAQYVGIINSIPTVPEYPKEIIINQNQVDTIISIINSNNKQLKNK